MNVKTIIGLVLIAGFTVVLLQSFGNQVSGYETFAEAAQSGRQAHVVGDWVREQPMRYDPASNEFSFTMTDEAGEVQRVVYRNPKPANFEEAEQVVVNGQFENGVFVAEHILVKCPSKYNDQRGAMAPEGPTASI